MKSFFLLLLLPTTLLIAQPKKSSATRIQEPGPTHLARQGNPPGGASGIVPTIQPGQSAESIGRYLNPDGTLNTPPGFRGTLDPAGYTMNADADGKPVFVRAGSEVASVPEDERWDERFSYPGITPNGSAYVVAVQGANVYVGGNIHLAGATPVNYIAKWDGVKWDSLGGGTNGTVYAILIKGSDLYVGGYFTTAGGMAANNIAMWDGATWSALGDGLNNSVAILATMDTLIFAGGGFTMSGDSVVPHIARWDGSVWSPLGSGTDGWVNAIVPWDSGLYIGGTFDTADGSPARNIVTWDGVNFSTLGSGVNSDVYTLAIRGTDLYAGGYFDSAGSVLANKIALWNGSTWSALGTGFPPSTDYVQSLAVIDTDLYAGGEFTSAGGVPANNIARWNGTSWSAVDAGVNNYINFFTVDGSTLYAVGGFNRAGNEAAGGIASWDGSSWSTIFAPGARYGVNGGWITSMAVMGSDLYVGGVFTIAGVTGTNYIARWDGSAWSPLGDGLNWYPNALAVSGSDLYVGGFFSMAGGDSASNIARWDGANWHPLGSGVDYVVAAIAVIDTDIYVGGQFNNAGGAPASKVARWDGSTWSPLGLGVSSTVLALAARDSILYVGGGFTTAGGAPANRIAQWDGSNWTALATTMTKTGNQPSVWSLAVTDSFLYMGGVFETVDGDSAVNIARWNGSTWSALGSGLDGNAVHSMAIVDDTLYAGGYFAVSGVNRNIAKWDGSAWLALGSGTNQTVEAIQDFDGDLFVGGYFTMAGGKISNYIAAWKGLGSSVELGLDPRWNLVSLPVVPADSTVTVLYPDAESQAFGYSGGYNSSLTMGRGTGYWLKYPPAGGTVNLQGFRLSTLDVPVEAGWNLVGSVADPVNVAWITSEPPGMITSNFFAYHGSYSSVDSLRPGEAYWVKVDSNGTLKISSVGPAIEPAAAIRIRPTSELPPAPPQETTEGSSASDLPVSYSLAQNYPNPFNPVTTIRYALPEANRVTLTIYNLLGQKVAVLVDGEQEAGFKAISFDAGSIPSGIYVYRITAGAYTDVKKMMLLK